VDGTVFISHSRSDTAYAKLLDAYFGEHGVFCLIDDSVKPGQDFASMLAERGESCAAVVVVMTPAGRRSPRVIKAIAYALAHNVAVVPLLLGGKPFELAGIHGYEDVQGEQLPGAVLVERLRSLARDVEQAGEPPAVLPIVRVDGQIMDIREYLGETAVWFAFLAVAALLGWVEVGHWSASMGQVYGAVAGLALMTVATAVGMRWAPVAMAAAWIATAIAAVVLVIACVLLWRTLIQHHGSGWFPPAAAVFAAGMWAAGTARLAKVVAVEAEIKSAAREHEKARQRAAATLWLSAGEPPAIFWQLLRDHVRGLRTGDAYFRYALVSSTSVVFVNTSGMKARPEVTSAAANLAQWARRVRGRGYSINVTPTFVAIDERVPVASVMTVDDVDIVRVPSARFAPTVGPLLDRGARSLYMPLLAGLLLRSLAGVRNRPAWVTLIRYGGAGRRRRALVGVARRA
jgi:hypothetical protein